MKQPEINKNLKGFASELVRQYQIMFLTSSHTNDQTL